MFQMLKRAARRSALVTTVSIGLAFTAAAASAQTNLNGAGATFPEPVYQKWIADYTKAHPNVKINYTGIGSGGGIKGITDKTLDFAGSDAPLNAKELQGMGGEEKVVQVPSVAGGVVPAYNLPGVKQELKFTGEMIADIFLGKISKWDDAAIAKLNPGVQLPNTAITPAWRTDGSGTTYVFTNYLATQSKDFRNRVGVGKAVKWPAGAGGNGNAGVAAVIKNVPGALGYLEQQYASGNNIPFGAVQNADGEFVKATPDGVSKAGEGAAESLKGHVLAANLWNQKGKGVYPIASFTYLIVYKDLNNIKTREQAQALVDYLWWSTHDGQRSVGAMSYAPLAPAVQKKVEEAINTVTFQGQPVKPQGVAAAK
jgi:phosphate transport system substrate-binding protein